MVQRFLVFRLRTLPAWNHCHLQKKKLQLHITVITIVGSNLKTKCRHLAKTLEKIPLQNANLNLRQVIFCKFSHCLLVDAPLPPKHIFLSQSWVNYEARRSKSDFASFQSSLRLFLLTYFVKCTRTLLKLNSKGPYSSSESEITFRRWLFTFFIKHEIRHFNVMVVQKRQSNVHKSMCTCKVVFLLIKPIVF